ncbi:hypothetical protein G9A89_000945 [Geosiphon pyriformis]|nr:hypothetical protein G9A89_000945 [Geosiphon pyriformis]
MTDSKSNKVALDMDKNFETFSPKFPTNLTIDEFISSALINFQKTGKFGRIPNAFIIYRKEVRKEFIKKNQRPAMRHLSCVAGYLWTKEPTHVKDVYYQLTMKAQQRLDEISKATTPPIIPSYYENSNNCIATEEIFPYGKANIIWQDSLNMGSSSPMGFESHDDPNFFSFENHLNPTTHKVISPSPPELSRIQIISQNFPILSEKSISKQYDEYQLKYRIIILENAIESLFAVKRRFIKFPPPGNLEERVSFLENILLILLQDEN